MIDHEESIVPVEKDQQLAYSQVMGKTSKINYNTHWKRRAQASIDNHQAGMHIIQIRQKREFEK